MKKINKNVLIALLVVFGVLIGYAVGNIGNLGNSEEKNDFYEAINKEILNEKELDSDEGYWGLFGTETQDIIDDKAEAEVKSILENKENYSQDSDEYKITKLYNSCINKKDDLTTLNNYIKMINNSQNMNRLMDNILKINDELSLGIIIGTSIGKDFKDNSKIMIAINGFAFDGTGAGDYYINPLYSQYAGAFIKYDRELLKIYGYSEEEARDAVKRLFKVYTEIAKESKTIEESAKIENMYNVETLNELKEIYSNINIASFLKKFNKYDTIMLSDVKQAKKVNSLLTDEYLKVWKEYAIIEILRAYGPYAHSDYLKLADEMSAILQGTDVTTDTIEDKAIDLITTYFDSEISQRYVKKHVNKEDIEVFRSIIKDIISEYETKIKDNSWLSKNTKEKALLKLENMKINVGYPSTWEDYSKDYKLNDNLLDNIIQMKKVQTEFAQKLIENHEEFWIMSPMTVNAFYNPQDNSINFPAALLEARFYSKDNTYYQKLGALGAIIGHEISHSFDDNGALFDEKGNLNNWWTENDYKEFEKKQQEVIDYYNEFKMNGMRVNGKLTVGENIADLGGVSVIVSVAKRKGATNEDLKELFKSYANLWASKATDEYTMMQMMTDSHSPDKIRVNAVLSSIEEFYNVFEITKNNGMYKDQKVKVW